MRKKEALHIEDNNENVQNVERVYSEKASKRENKFMTFLYIETNRIFKFFMPAILVYITIVLLKGVMTFKEYIGLIESNAKKNAMTIEQYMNSDIIQKNSINNFLGRERVIMLGLGILLAAVLVYSLIIWYREWFGSTRVIYSLLTLPYNRGKIMLAKLSTILLMLFSAISAFIISVVGYYFISKAMLPVNSIEPYKLATLIGYVETFFEYRYTLITIFLALIILAFLLCIFERSYGLKGLLLTVLIGVGYLAITLITLRSGYFYNGEKQLISIGVNIITALGAILFSDYLLKKKVSI